MAGRVRGSLESVPTITAADLRTFMHNVFARDQLKIAIVGEYRRRSAGKLIDKVFGGLPAKSRLAPVPAVESRRGSGKDLRRSRRPAIGADHRRAGHLARDDPDFIAAFMLNHILGGSCVFVAALQGGAGSARARLFGLQRRRSRSIRPPCS